MCKRKYASKPFDWVSRSFIKWLKYLLCMYTFEPVPNTCMYMYM